VRPWNAQTAVCTSEEFEVAGIVAESCSRKTYRQIAKVAFPQIGRGHSLHWHQQQSQANEVQSTHDSAVLPRTACYQQLPQGLSQQQSRWQTALHVLDLMSTQLQGLHPEGGEQPAVRGQ
jgi:hypothetical protein